MRGNARNDPRHMIVHRLDLLTLIIHCLLDLQCSQNRCHSQPNRFTSHEAPWTDAPSETEDCLGFREVRIIQVAVWVKIDGIGPVDGLVV